MASGASNYLETAILNVDRGMNITAASSYYWALWVGDPTDTGSGGAEVSGSGTGYSRKAISAASGSWTAPADDGTGKMASSNTADIAWDEAEADWGTITHVVCFDAATGGNMRWIAELDAAKAIVTGNTFTIESGDLTRKVG